MSLMTSSRDFPAPLPVLGCTDRIDSSMSNVAVCEFVISALSWSPNASGEGLSGSFSIYSMYWSIVVASGWRYMPDYENLWPTLSTSELRYT